MRPTSPSAGRLVVDRARLRLHLDLELVLGDLAVALEGDAIDDLLGDAERHDDPPVDHLGVDRGIDAGRPQVVDAALDRGRVRSGEIGLEARGSTPEPPSTTICCAKAGEAGTKSAEGERHRQNQSAEEAANPTHVAHSPSSRRGDDRRPRRSSSALDARPRFDPPRSSCDARRTTPCPLPARGNGTFNGLLPFSATPANLYSASLHHFARALPRGHAKMVDHSLIAARRPAAGGRARW